MNMGCEQAFSHIIKSGFLIVITLKLLVYIPTSFRLIDRRYLLLDHGGSKLAKRTNPTYLNWVCFWSVGRFLYPRELNFALEDSGGRRLA